MSHSITSVITIGRLWGISKYSFVCTGYLCFHNTLQWPQNERDGVSIHRRIVGLLNHLLSRRSKKTSKLRVTGLCEGNSPVIGEFAERGNVHWMTSSWAVMFFVHVNYSLLKHIIFYQSEKIYWWIFLPDDKMPVSFMSQHKNHKEICYKCVFLEVAFDDIHEWSIDDFGTSSIKVFFFFFFFLGGGGGGGGGVPIIFSDRNVIAVYHFLIWWDLNYWY